MDKKTLRKLAILMLIVGSAAIVIGCIGISEAKPSTYSTGYVMNGEYVQIGTGKIGGSSKQKSDMELVRNIGILVFVGGAGCMIGSITMKPGQKIDLK